MANKTIPAKDKVLVVHRIAEGQSTREAIRGTCIKSNQTAARIARSKSNEITRLRHNYAEEIMEYAELSAIERAKMWGEMTRATKLVPVRYSGYLPPSHTSYSGYTSVPDWNARYKALVYLDKLQGINVDGPSVQVNVMQQVNASDREKQAPRSSGSKQQSDFVHS